MLFDYPASPHQRRHGPVGYVDYQSFKAWLFARRESLPPTY
jgi:hypothetical protein